MESCVVCGDRANGRHYGVISCEGCKGFFKRSIRKHLEFNCRIGKKCKVTKDLRNHCQYCRLQKCLEMGMRINSVQQERKCVQDNRNISYTCNNSVPREKSKIFIRKDLKTFQSDNFKSLNFCDINENHQSFNLPPHESDEETSESELTNDPKLSARKNNLIEVWSMLNKVISEDDNEDTFTYYENFDGQLITKHSINFSIDLPIQEPILNNANYVCEVASRILFSAIRWTKTIAEFKKLSNDLQLTLIRRCWPELFVLALAECSEYIPIKTMVIPSLFQLRNDIVYDPNSYQKHFDIAENAMLLYDTVNRLIDLQCDTIEYAFLKAITLFSWNLPGLPASARRHIDCLQDKAVQELAVYKGRTNSDGRSSNLIIRLLPLRQLKPKAMADIFFSSCIGSINVETVIPHILEMEPDVKTDYNSQPYIKLKLE